MALERTLSILKPDATRRNLIGQITTIIEANDFRIICQRMLQLSSIQAQAFYYEHHERGFYQDLVTFMTSGPVVVQVLEAENAIEKYRKLMGATNPSQAQDGTIRKQFAQSVEANSVHGSDSKESAAREIAFFFAGFELVQPNAG